MRWLLRSLKALTWLVVLALLVSAITAWLYMRRANPRHDGVMSMPGLRAAVTVERDAHGIPTIKANSMTDAMHALGVVHAQDRLWQLDLHRRIGSGRMAEAVGEPGLETDRFLRILGVKRNALAQWAHLQNNPQAAQTKEVLEAYAQGINQTVTHHTPARPPEMLILGVDKEPWTPADSLAWYTMMGWDLSNNWQAELLRLRLALKLPTQRVHELMPPYPGDKPLSSVDLAALYAELRPTKKAAQDVDTWLERMAQAAWPSGIEGSGSNNWVLSGTRTNTGKPLLANDPHLKLTTPALWYLVRIEIPGLKVAGASLPGLPAIVLGQNQHIAWGFTNTTADVQDLFLERLDPSSPNSYITPEGPKAMTVVQEIIKVKGKADVKLDARSTRHGPVISDAGTMNDLVNATAKMAIAMQWTALDPHHDPASSGLAMMQATSVTEFVNSSRGFAVPMQNMVVADTAGRIGMVSAGRLPKRGPDNDLQGSAPAPGWLAQYDWQGFVPADETPREFDPGRGFIATANQRIHGADYPHLVTGDWVLPYRQQRIEQLLQAKPRSSLADLRDMQADVKSLAANELLPYFKKARSAHPLASAAHPLIDNFDGQMLQSSGAAALYWVWFRQLNAALFVDEVGAELFDRSLMNRTFHDAVGWVLTQDLAWWCDDKGTPASETCPQQVDAALTRALDEMQTLQGKDPTQWRWGALHVLKAEHRPFSRVKPLSWLFELRTPMGGDPFTVNALRVQQRPDSTGQRYVNDHGASYRGLYDVADPTKSRFIQSSGQSGLFWSKHYRDLLGPWSKVEDLPLWPDAKDSGKSATSVLTLTPP
jgi:penicillin G amidase